MGRRSLAESFYEDLEVENTRKYEWIVTYDFHDKPNRNFYSNLKRLREMLPDAGMEQFSVFKTSDLRGALTAWKLVAHYGGKVALYRVREVDPEDPETRIMLGRITVIPWLGGVIMRAIRTRLEEEDCQDYKTLMKILIRFYNIQEQECVFQGETRTLFYTRDLLDPETPTIPVAGAWIERGEVEAILEATDKYIREKIKESEARGFLEWSIVNALKA